MSIAAWKRMARAATTTAITTQVSIPASPTPRTDQTIITSGNHSANYFLRAASEHCAFETFYLGEYVKTTTSIRGDRLRDRLLRRPLWNPFSGWQHLCCA